MTRIILIIFLMVLAAKTHADPQTGHTVQNQRATAPKLMDFPEVGLKLPDVFENRRGLQSLVAGLGPASSIGNWTQVFEMPANQTWSCEKGKLVSLYQVAKARLKKTPEKLHDLNQATAALAMNEWRKLSHSDHFPTYADNIAYQYPLTPAAKEALYYMVYNFRDHDEQAIASLYADQLLNDFPMKEQKDGALLLLADVYERTGQTDKVAGLLKEVEGRGPESVALAKEKHHATREASTPKQNVKSKLRELALSKDAEKRELFLRLARMMNPEDFLKKLDLKFEDDEECLVLALNENAEQFSGEIAKVKIKLGVPFADAIPHFEFAQIKAGKFVMGSPDGTTKDKEGNVIAAEIGRGSDEAPHEVEITKPYWIQKNEVTQLQYEAVMGENPSNFKKPTNPVEMVSWSDAQKFIEKLNQLDPHHTYRLPTEAEWEYAARAGTDTPYSFGKDAKDLGEYAVYAAPESPAGGPQKVAELKPNAFGLYDMHGNVWEWVQDGYTEKPPSGVDPVVASGSYRVIRGGCWRYDAQNLRSAYRSYYDPGLRGSSLGFRLVRTPK